jgi:hypothetical protein
MRLSRCCRLEVIRIWQLQGWNQGLMAITPRLTHVGLHQRACALQLRCGETRPVPQHGRHPLLLTLVAAKSPVEIRERQAHQQIAAWSGIENAGVVDDGEAIPARPQTGHA